MRQIAAPGPRRFVIAAVAVILTAAVAILTSSSAESLIRAGIQGSG